ncbi:MAG TPA: homoserine O-acetyltransferase [Fimbriimonas sp.]
MDPALFEENERTSPVLSRKRFVEIGPISCEAGGYLPNVEVAYETWGRFTGDNAVLVCHALSGDSHAVGWWDRLVGPGKAIDTERYFVIGQNCLGGCQGTTGPSSDRGDGQPYGSTFPIVTVRDMVEVQARLLDALRVNRLRCVAGGSMGGMQALQWAVQYPQRVDKVFCTASAPAHSAMQIGFNEAARQAVMRDPKWRGGDYPLDDPPADGLSVARMIGHLSFLSEQAFEVKFGRRLQSKDKLSYHLGVEYQIESYLNYQGDKFTTRFDANSLLLLSKAIDFYDLRSLEGALAEFLFVSYTTDWLYPSHQAARAHDMALVAGCRSQHSVIDLPYGHDAFLLDGEHQGALLRAFLERELGERGK